MANKEKLLGALGLARRAGKLGLGFDEAEVSCQTGRATLVLLAADTSRRTAQRAAEFSEGRADCLTLPLTQEELLRVSGKRVAVYAVLDENFAVLCRRANQIEEDQPNDDQL